MWAKRDEGQKRGDDGGGNGDFGVPMPLFYT